MIINMKTLLLITSSILFTLFWVPDFDYHFNGTNDYLEFSYIFEIKSCTDKSSSTNHYDSEEVMKTVNEDNVDSNACLYEGNCRGGDNFCGGMCVTRDGCEVCFICTDPLGSSPGEN